MNAGAAPGSRKVIRGSSTDLPPELLEHKIAIEAKAREYGLDFFEVVFEASIPTMKGTYCWLLDAFIMSSRSHVSDRSSGSGVGADFRRA